jgi:hypothetical protein
MIRAARWGISSEGKTPSKYFSNLKRKKKSSYQDPSQSGFGKYYLSSK